MIPKSMIFSGFAVASGTLTVALFANDRAWLPAAVTALAVALAGFVLGASWAGRRSGR